MPKGGGAVRGIGEKFSSIPVTGTGSLTVPLATSAGRNGFGPNLELSYDSGAGNGPFGLGWSCSHQSITRKTDKGIPRYDDDDVFVLSSAEDLVPAFKKNADGTWAKDAHGEHLFDEEARNGYQVRRYRPRVEGLFARIERWTRDADGDVHWRAFNKDNTITVYGGTEESRIFDPADPRKVFSWLPCQSYDDKGNAILYRYASEDAENVDLGQNNEENRVRTAARYLKRIQYGNRRSLLLDPTVPSFRQPHDPAPDLSDADWMFEMVFSYGAGEYTEQAPDVDGRVFASATIEPPVGKHWPARSDPFSAYRSAFEVRQYRLCRQVLLFHHFQNELGVADCLVRSTDLSYTEKPNGTYLSGVTQSGYKRIGATYLKRSLPPLEFDYSPSPLDDLTYDVLPIQDVDEESLANAPFGVAGGGYRLVDLDGEGIAGILAEQNGAWFYKSNLGEGRFGPASERARIPASRSARGASQLMDIGGDGLLDLVDFGGPVPGFYGRDEDAGWQDFRPFRLLPEIDWKDANLRFLDLTGDGYPDLLLTGDAVVSTWYQSAAEEGFTSGHQVYGPLDERQGPRYLFGDGTESIYTADMSGDGLSDVVRIRNGEVSYWPNLGYGRFGAKVTLDNVGWFDDAASFDQRRIHLTDTDGSGPTDIVYVGRDGVRVYLNYHGNSLSEPRLLERVGVPEDPGHLSVADLLGRGTACVVWSSALPSQSRSPMRFLDLMGGVKPHLLIGIRNNLGAETHIEYASSTRFYLADKAAGTPWTTRLPFPVHVVVRVESRDLIAGSRFASTYSYHHGYFDGPEREFRGFGRVDETDSQEFGDFQTPPTLTKTWYHVGNYVSGERISQGFAHEYYVAPGDTEEALLNDTVLPAGLTYDEAREAVRALHGNVLRQEIYALDGRSEPYSISERNYTLEPVQPRGGNRYSVVFAHPRETIDSSYERKLYPILGGQVAQPDVVALDPPGLKWLFDPKVSHHFILSVDEYGDVLREATVNYGRRYADSDPLLSSSDRNKQGQLVATLTESTPTNAVVLPDAYRSPGIACASTYELVKVKPAGLLFKFEELSAIADTVSSGTRDIPYEDVKAASAMGPGPFRRLIERDRTRFRANNLALVLPDGKLECLAIESESYKLAFTAGLLAAAYKDLLPNPSLVMPSVPGKPDTGGYVDLDGDGSWWLPTGRSFFHPDPAASAGAELAEACAHFFTLRRFRDDFGQMTTADYVHDLLPQQTRDPVGNTVTAVYDYRALQPKEVTDANGNRSSACFDALGMAVAIAVQGKPGENVGDSLAQYSELDTDPTLGALKAFFADPNGQAAALLGNASSRFVYDVERFDRCGTPTVAVSLVRDTHVLSPAGSGPGSIHIAFIYSDGFGREVQTKFPAEAGPAPQRAAPAVVDGDVQPGALALDGAGKPVLALAASRWIGKGRTVYDNKGNPVKQYEPFFSSTYLYETEPEMTQTGVSPILIYDPVGREIGILHPDHTLEKTVYEPWRREMWDANDACLIANPSDDPDVGPALKLLPQADYLPTWHDARIGGQLGNLEQQAAQKAAAHAATPALAYLDPLGRPMLTIADNGPAGKFATRHVLDVEGNEREVWDAKGRLVRRNEYDIIGNLIGVASMEAGTRWLLNDATGHPIRSWDSRGHTARSEYDELRRPVRHFVKGWDVANPDSEIRYEQIVYGDSAASGLTSAQMSNLNLRGRIYRHFDGAGVSANEAYDFKGNVTRATRRLLADYTTPPDWTQNPTFENETFTGATTYDALNRPIQFVTPHSDRSGTKVSVVQPVFGEGNLLEKVYVWLDQATEPTDILDSASATTTSVTNMDYDAKGQRLRIEYGNGVTTEYTYDPETFRLRRLKTSGDRTEGGFISRLFGNATSTTATFQDLNYVYDPVGNITNLRDSAQQTIYFSGQIAESASDYTYDAVYRLVSATGREHVGQSSSPETTWDDRFRVNRPSPTDPGAMRPYGEQYEYDELGNLLKLIHQAAQGNWTRQFSYTDASQLEPGKSGNRLSGATIGGTPEAFTYDAHGNFTSMPHLTAMSWDFRDRLSLTSCQAVNPNAPPATVPETTFYVYDGGGQRVRKVTRRQNGSRKEERIYLAGFEVYRKYQGDGVTVALERETLHLMDDGQAIALVETRTVGNDGSPKQLVRYQHGNHLGSVSLELDDKANPITYEEYYPYGSTSYSAIDSSMKAASKRYRFSGKERDSENGFGYHGARYYAPWLARWTACDAAFKPDLSNAYEYVRSNPIFYHDPNGKEWTRFWGGVRALGGAAQAVGGVAFAAGTAETGVGIAVGLFAAAHGVSDLEAGCRQMVSGKQEQSVIEVGISKGLQKGFDVEEKKADAAAGLTDAAMGFVNPSGPVAGGPRALALVGGGSRTIVAVETVSHAPAMVQTISMAAHVPVAANAISTTIQVAKSGPSSSSSSSSGSGGSGGAGKPAGNNPKPKPPSKAAGVVKGAANAASKLARPTQEISTMVAKEGSLTELANQVKRLGQGKGATVEIVLAKTKDGKDILVAGINSGSKGLTGAQIKQLKAWGVNIAPEWAKGMKGGPHAEENIAAFLKQIGARGVRWSRAVVGELKQGRSSSYVCERCQKIIKSVGGVIEGS